MYFINNFTFVFLLIFTVEISQQRSLPAKCRSEFMDQVNAAKHGYCWKFNPRDLDEKSAAAYCKQQGGHLVTLDSHAKGKALGEFVKDSVALTAKDYFGKEVGSRYRVLIQKNIKWGYNPWITISSVRSDRGRTWWTATGRDVEWGAYADSKTKKHSPGNTRCPAFTRIINKWIYMRDCKSFKHPSVCEQSKHVLVVKPPIPTTATRRPTTKRRTTRPTTRRRTTTTTRTTTTRPTTRKTTTKATTPSAEDYYPGYYYYYDGYYYYYK